MKFRFSLFLFLSLTFAFARADRIEDTEFDNLGISVEEEIRVLRGNLYFSYLKGDYEKTLIYIQEWENKKISDDLDEVEIIKSSVYLALGMEEQALDAYHEAANAKVTASGNAWYFLARRFLYYGEFGLAEECAINALSENLTQLIEPQNKQEALQIWVTSLANQGKIADAIKIIKDMKRKTIWMGYARYNLIVAMIENNFDSRHLEELVAIAIHDMPDTLEGEQLRDRILLVAAIDATNRTKYKLANKYFQSISLDSIFVSPALLHYGWSLFYEGKFVDAAQPWLTLRHQQEKQSLEAIEALMAVSHTMEQLYALNQAIRAYDDVEKRLKQAIEEIEQVRSDSEYLIGWLIEWQEENKMQPWGWNRHLLPDIKDDQITKYIYPLLSRDDFSQHLERLYDFYKIKTELTDDVNQLSLWQSTVAERSIMLAELNAEQRMSDFKVKQESIIRSGLKINVQLFDDTDDRFSFATPGEKEKIARLEKIVDLIIYIQSLQPEHQQLGTYKERWRQSYGLTLWNVYMNAPQRKFNLDRDYKAMRDQIDRVQQKMEYTASSIAWSGETWLGVETRIIETQSKLADLLLNVEREQSLEEEYLLVNIQEYMEDLQQRYLIYLAQVRLALARLYDDAISREPVGAVNKDSNTQETDTPTTPVTGGQE